MAARVRQLAAGLDHAAVIPLRNVLQPGMTPLIIGGIRVVPTADLARKIGSDTYRSESRLYVATPTPRHAVDRRTSRRRRPERQLFVARARRACTDMISGEVGSHRVHPAAVYAASCEIPRCA
jgi:hypothetical protein